jgi:hypothetical protein
VPGLGRGEDRACQPAVRGRGSLGAADRGSLAAGGSRLGAPDTPLEGNPEGKRGRGRPLGSPADNPGADHTEAHTLGAAAGYSVAAEVTRLRFEASAGRWAADCP